MKDCSLIVLLLVFASNGYTQNLVNYVQTLSGTAPSTTTAALKHSEAGSEKNANTIPSVTRPFAMTQWVAQTRRTELKCIPPYFYKDSLFSGVRASHWINGSCTQDYGSVTLMAKRGSLPADPYNYSIPFSHENEKAGPALYQLDFPRENLDLSFSASLRSAIIKFRLRVADSLYLFVSPNSEEKKGFIKVDAATGEVWGYNPVHRIYQGWGEYAGFKGWFYIKFDKPFAVSGSYAEGRLMSATTVQEKADIGVFLGWKLAAGETITASMGTSFTSLAAAKANFEAEIGKKSFDELVQESTNEWERSLATIQVKGKDEKSKRIFYTALYHSFQHPRLMNDVDGGYPQFASIDQIDQNRSRNYYDDFSMWDIYRSQLPLVEIIDSARVSDFVFSLIEKGKSGGWLPIFPCWNNYTAAMIGDHCAAFISGAFVKGIRNYNINDAYRLMRKNAFESPANKKDYINGMGRRALSSYLQYGFIPMEDSVQEAFHKKEQVSRTLEYCFDDYALSKVAKALGKPNDYQKLKQRSLNYQNIFDCSVGMVRGRYSNGDWVAPFEADKRVDYITEGTSRQYSFYIPHDIPGLATLMGGRIKLEQSLDSLFLKQEYWHGNEPGHHIPFLYNYTNAPWKTQQVVTKILEEEYSDGPGGLSGNDDAGQMSAWYIFASIGFYPVNPASDEYQLCTPLFDAIELTVASSKKFQILCRRASKQSSYIQSILYNGKPYTKTSISYKMLQEGGRLEIVLSDRPTSWGKLSTGKTAKK